jgi:hypothetical protein
MIVVDLRRIWSSIHHDHEKQNYYRRFLRHNWAGGVSGTGDTARMMAQFGARIHHPGLAAIANRPALLKSAAWRCFGSNGPFTPMTGRGQQVGSAD